MEKFIHNSGHNPCGKIAFFAKKRGPYSAYPSTKINEIVLLDGTHPLPDIHLKCGSCGEDFTMYEEVSFVTYSKQLPGVILT